MQEQTPGFPHGDGDCAAPGCDCGKSPCGFYLWNHSSTVSQVISRSAVLLIYHYLQTATCMSRSIH